MTERGKEGGTRVYEQAVSDESEVEVVKGLTSQGFCPILYASR